MASAFNTVFAAQQISGKVTTVINSAGFTYAEVDTGMEKVWAAGTGTTPLNKGDMIAFSTEMPMQNFHSKSLGRNFPVIYFVKSFITDNVTPSADSPHGMVNDKPIIKPFAASFANKAGEVKVGSYLREATLDGLNVSSRKLSEFKGKPLIINVWASWCGPCQAEMGSLERLAKKHNGKDFNIIGISTDDYRNKAEAAIARAQLTFENFLDNKLMLEKMLGANTIPLTLLVDEKGRVLEKVRGAREWDSPEIKDAISKAFNIRITP